MKRGSTLFLKGFVVLIGTIVLALCTFALPQMWKGGPEEFPEASRAVFLIVIGLYATAVPFFIALWQTLKLIRYIELNKAFSDLSVKALRNIKYCATAIAVLYIGGVPLLLPIAQADDAPGLVLMGMVVASAPLAIATFAAILQRVLEDAIAIKSENDLTI